MASATPPAKARPGPRIERADLGQHVEQILLVDAAEALQRCEIAAAEQVEMGDQRAHRRIEPVARGELQRQAFGEVAGEQAGRLEGPGRRRAPRRRRVRLDAEASATSARSARR